MSRSILLKEVKLLCLQSGGVCAFPGCRRSLTQPGTSQDDPVILGEIAHIVADSRQGPRGTAALTEEERNKHTNLILLCGDHHKTIDSQPSTYSIAVLRQMKADHEFRIRSAATPAVAEPYPELKVEKSHSTLLAITHLPQAVFAAGCSFHDGQEDLVRQRITYPSRREELVPFILREKNLLAFHDLRTANNPFAAVIDFQTVEMIRATDLWRDAEGKRRYITLLNRALYKYTSRLAIRYDPAHYRFYFPIEEKGRERIVQYRSLEGRRSKRKVAWQPKQKSTGEPRKFWWHLAVALRFQQMSDTQWCLSVRPERHLTSDGETPLPPNQIGRRVTRLKARMYFEQALSKVKQYDLLALFPTSEVRLVRAGRYPPLRGTAFRVGDVSYLYTSGYLATLGGYPHGHVPSPLQIADHVGDTSRAQLLREIMVLTKMNWNSANFSGLMPITLRFSRLVGNILREVPAGETPQPKYKYYM